MILFERKPASYSNDSNNHKPVGLFNCLECGATVAEINKQKHEDWHINMDKKLANEPEYTKPYVNNIYPSDYYPPTITWSGGAGTSNVANYPKGVVDGGTIV